jgi:D-alanyl-D-alanine carboxypeptidase
MKRLALGIMAALLGAAACSGELPERRERLLSGSELSLVSEPLGERSSCTRWALERRLRAILQTAREEAPDNRGLLLAVRVQSLHFAETFASGPLRPQATFRIASVTKPFTAAAILRLVEDGRLSLDDTISEAVPEPYPSLLRSDGYDPDAITISHLLTHTSGLFDYAFGSEDYQQEVLRDPSRVWTREDQVRFAMQYGDPLAAPGELHAYSDTGYVLLGAILEARTQQNLGDALASLLGFRRLGLHTTWLEDVQRAPWYAPRRAPQTYEGLALADLSASVDLWGGGGLVSTTHDLTRFYEALLGGEVFRRPETLATMLSIPPPNVDEGVAMGLYRANLGPDVTCWGHDGLWGVAVLACPSIGLSAAVLGLDVPESDPVLGQVFVNSLLEAAACVR